MRAVTSVGGAGIEEDGKHSSVRSSYMDEADEEEAIPSGQVSCPPPPQAIDLRTLDSSACGPSRQLIAALKRGQGISLLSQSYMHAKAIKGDIVPAGHVTASAQHFRWQCQVERRPQPRRAALVALQKCQRWQHDCHAHKPL